MATTTSVTYSDQFKTIQGELVNDGQTVTLILEGNKFVSGFLDDFRPEDPVSLPPGRFKLNLSNMLDACTLEFDIRIELIFNGQPALTSIRLRLLLDDPNDLYCHTRVSGILALNNEEVGAFSSFEGLMEGIKSALPFGYVMKCCYGCTYSDYNIAGDQFFGSMACFRNMKLEYLQVRSKEQYMNIMDNCEMHVQETYLCPEFEPRPPHIGYRG